MAARLYAPQGVEIAERKRERKEGERERGGERETEKESERERMECTGPMTRG